MTGSPIASSAPTIRVMIADDESLARLRLRTLLGDIAAPATAVVGEYESAQGVLDALATHTCDLVLLDIRMPGLSGLALAQQLRHSGGPKVVLITAHAEHALQAFDMDVVDYLTKPVRRERLQQALDKVALSIAAQRRAAAPAGSGDWGAQRMAIPGRSGIEWVDLDAVLYCKAELKYITVATAQQQYILDSSLNELEQRYAGRFLRIHRNALVAPRAIAALLRPGTVYVNRGAEEAGEEVWFVRLHGVSDLLQVSRRQLPSVRKLLTQG